MDDAVYEEVDYYSRMNTISRNYSTCYPELAPAMPLPLHSIVLRSNNISTVRNICYGGTNIGDEESNADEEGVSELSDSYQTNHEEYQEQTHL